MAIRLAVFRWPQPGLDGLLEPCAGPIQCPLRYCHVKQLLIEPGLKADRTTMELRVQRYGPGLQVSQ